MLHTTFRQLEVFVAVVEAGSFIGGADRLGISQPAVSNHIRALENQVGCQVLERRRGTVCVLTRDGRNLYERAIDLLERAGSIAKELPRTSRANQRTPLKVWAPVPLANRWLVPYLSEFIDQNPGTHLAVEMGSFEEAATKIREAQVDIAYLHASGPIADFASEVVGQERHGIFVLADHPLAKDLSKLPQALQEVPLVMPSRNSHFHRIIEKSLHDRGIRRYTSSCELLDASIIRKLILGGKVASLFHYMLEEEIASGKVVELIDLPPIEIRQVFQPRAVAAKAAEAFASGVRRLLEQSVEGAYLGKPRSAASEGSRALN